jgi:hypothetical protein
MSNVKINRDALINALKKSLAVKQAELAKYAKACQEYDNEQKKFHAQIIKDLTTGKIKINPERVRTHAAWRNDKVIEVDVSFELPSRNGTYPSPTPSCTEGDVAEIERILKMLEISEPDTVSVTLFKNISHLI